MWTQSLKAKWLQATTNDREVHEWPWMTTNNQEWLRVTTSDHEWPWISVSRLHILRWNSRVILAVISLFNQKMKLSTDINMCIANIFSLNFLQLKTNADRSVILAKVLKNPRQLMAPRTLRLQRDSRKKKLNLDNELFKSVSFSRPREFKFWISSSGSH